MTGNDAAYGGEPESSDGLKAFGAVLKVFRRRARLTQEELAPRVCYSVQTISSVEQGRRLPPADLVERAEVVLDAFGALKAAAQHAVRRPGLASWFREWARLEEEAVSLCTYECRVIPGLLQTEAYARAVTLSVPPPKSENQVADQVSARLDRQHLLRDRPNTAYSFIVEQALIERQVGGVDVTRELIDHLVTCAQLPNMEIQVMPLCQPWHAGADGPMQLLETSAHQWLGYSEAQRSGMLITESGEVSVLSQRYAKLRSQAETPEESMDLLRRMRGSLCAN
ncbi:helix-turn-helix domain-containing protein [Streptomyces winkii]|uniref:helix-turn-helix domain-containing protein n=1 Tax=Streptomyces winkii TaxID=3051178 RepID=UPI0028D5AC42|nr:helix-turn-helix transcriptional regulator [Streptomyces sp. DSM 40971]